MSDQPTTRMARIKKALLKAAVVAALVMNAVVVLPGIAMSIISGHYAPSIALVLLSLAAWSAGRGLVTALRARSARLAEATAAD